MLGLSLVGYNCYCHVFRCGKPFSNNYFWLLKFFCWIVSNIAWHCYFNVKTFVWPRCCSYIIFFQLFKFRLCDIFHIIFQLHAHNHLRDIQCLLDVSLPSLWWRQMFICLYLDYQCCMHFGLETKGCHLMKVHILSMFKSWHDTPYRWAYNLRLD